MLEVFAVRFFQVSSHAANVPLQLLTCCQQSMSLHERIFKPICWPPHRPCSLGTLPCIFCSRCLAQKSGWQSRPKMQQASERSEVWDFPPCGTRVPTQSLRDCKGCLRDCVFASSLPTQMPTQAACPPLCQLELCNCAELFLARLCELFNCGARHALWQLQLPNRNFSVQV